MLQQHLHDQMMSQSEFCDVTLLVGGVEIRAHWCVLVSCPYFQSLYDSGLAERFSGTIELHIGKPASVRAAISYLYLGTVEVTYENVRELLEVADYFQITELKRACQDYLYSVNITTDNCVQICLMCSLYDLELYTRAFEFLRGNLPDVMQKEDILSLTHDSVITLLTDPSLCYVSQSDFFTFIVRWVQLDEEARKTYFEELFSALNLLGIPKKFLEEVVEKETLVNTNEKCKVHVLNIKMKYMTGLIEDSGTRDVIILAGGGGHGLYFNNLFHLFPFSECISVSSVYGFIVQEGRWIEFAPLPEQMRKPIITYDPRGFLYVFNSTHSNYSSVFIMYKYEICDKTWTSFRLKLPEHLSNIIVHNIVSCNSRLYAVLSAHMKSQVNNMPVEEWNTLLLEVREDDTESVVKCVFFARNTNTQITSLGVNNRHVCVMGWKHGIHMKKSRQFARFFLYDAVNQKKQEQSKGAYWDAVLIPMHKDLVACRMGKYAAKKYSFAEKRWKNIKELVLPLFPEQPSRLDYSSLSDGQNYYVFGGKDNISKKPLDSSFKYNFSTKEWTKLENMPQCLMQSAICQVKMPADHVRCHISCPHCVYHTRKSQAVYDVEGPFDDGDDDTDCEYSYDDDDDDFASDHWEDYFDYYDPYQDWY